MSIGGGRRMVNVLVEYYSLPSLGMDYELSLIHI